MHVSATMYQSNCVNRCAPSRSLIDGDGPTLPGDGMNKRLREMSGFEDVSEVYSVY